MSESRQDPAERMANWLAALTATDVPTNICRHSDTVALLRFDGRLHVVCLHCPAWADRDPDRRDHLPEPWILPVGGGDK